MLHGWVPDMVCLCAVMGMAAERAKPVRELLQAGRTRRPGKRITSPEKWEINQLIKAGVLDVSEYPTFDAEDGQVCMFVYPYKCIIVQCGCQLDGLTRTMRNHVCPARRAS